MMMADVMSQLVESALRAPENPEVLTDCETGSLGHQILQWLETAFPTGNRECRTLMERDPERFARRCWRPRKWRVRNRER